MLWTYFCVAYVFISYLLIFFSIVTLWFERKFMAIAQKRLGVSFLGRNGWIHLPADMVKFWLKYTGSNHGLWMTNSGGFLIVLVGFFMWNLLSCLFFIAEGGYVYFDLWDYQFLVYFGYINLTALFMHQVVMSASSKYATMASLRVLLLVIFMEVFFAICFLFMYLHIGGYSFDELSIVNSYSWLIFAMPPLALIYGLYAIFETKSAPFDHTEAESELVAGHLIEFGGRLLLFFYLSEYVHAYFCMFIIIVFVLGGMNAHTYLFCLSYISDCWFYLDIWF